MGSTTNTHRLLVPFLGFLLALLVSSPAWAGFSVPPKPSGPVYDGANVLSSAQERQLETKLEQFEKTSGIEIGVAVVPSLNGSPIREVGYEIAQKWGIGKKGENKGVLLLLVADAAKKAGPGATKCGCAAIEVGEYLEGDLTDSTSVKILKKEVLAPVVSGKFYEAADAGTKGIMAVVGGDAEAAKTYKNDSDGGGLPWWGWFIIIIAIIAFVVIFDIPIGGSGGGGYSGGGGSWGGGGGGSDFGGGGSFGGGGGSI